MATWLQKERFKFLKNEIDKCWHLGTILILSWWLVAQRQK
jgi:hypothetical protein